MDQGEPRGQALRVGLVGADRAGTAFLQLFASVPAVRVVAVADIMVAVVVDLMMDPEEVVERNQVVALLEYLDFLAETMERLVYSV